MKERDEYTPFGDEWRREMMQFPKAKMLDFLANVITEKADAITALQSELARAEPKWVPIKSDADLPKQDGFYWVSVNGAVFQCHIFTADKCWNGEVKPDAYMPIVKPEPYKL